MRVPKLGPVLTATALLSLGLAGCSETDPKKPATWVAKLESKEPAKAQEAARELRKLGAREAVGALVKALSHEDMGVRAEAAYALGTLGDPSAVTPLVEAVDLASTAKAADQASAKIAEALGALHDPKALPTLVKMVDATQPLVRLAAVDALAKFDDASVAMTLVKLVDDDRTPPLIVKHAIIGLGDQRAAAAVPALTRAMVLEKQGVSFYLEASYALLQIGEPAAKALVAIIDGSDADYAAWAEKKKRLPAGYLPKSAVVLADMGWQPAVAPITKLLSWKSPTGDEGHELLVHGLAAESLGRLRATSSAAAVAAQAGVKEANIRGQVAHAIAMIGDKAQAAKLEAAAKNPSDTWGARQEALIGLALLGDARQKPVVEAIQKAEAPDAAVKHCLAEESTESEAMKAARCEKERTARPQLLAGVLAALDAAAQCQSDAACWSGKLADKTTRVRERAAYALGALASAQSVESLVKLCKDDDLGVRRAAYTALDWLTREGAAKEALSAQRATLAQQLEAEKGKAYTVVVNEDLKRVVWKIGQL
ncbi:MAG: hypothetical protein RL199_1502 [Pseudomonadota bacterium]|jgi:HEAT repeat protein